MVINLSCAQYASYQVVIPVLESQNEKLTPQKNNKNTYHLTLIKIKIFV